ncbi:MAG: lipoate--protein ligase, partial [Oscillospiraceae bacterium]
MINKISYIISEDNNVYQNQALEEYLLSVVEKDECILYLWQNDKTVVIGRNQNSRAECDINALNKDGGHLARRLSGGGA